MESQVGNDDKGNYTCAGWMTWRKIIEEAQVLHGLACRTQQLLSL